MFWRACSGVGCVCAGATRGYITGLVDASAPVLGKPETEAEPPLVYTKATVLPALTPEISTLTLAAEAVVLSYRHVPTPVPLYCVALVAPQFVPLHDVLNTLGVRVTLLVTGTVAVTGEDTPLRESVATNLKVYEPETSGVKVGATAVKLLSAATLPPGRTVTDHA